MYMTYAKSEKTKLNLDILYDIYCIDVLNVSKEYCRKLKSLIKEIESDFGELLNLRLELDDNKQFFKI